MKRSDWIFAALTLAFLLAIGLSFARQGLYEPAPEESYRVFTARQTEDQTPAAEYININTASAEELEKLEGIGPALAEEIVVFRQKNGPFTCAEDLLKVSGIGEKTLQGFQDDIVWEKESDK